MASSCSRANRTQLRAWAALALLLYLFSLALACSPDLHHLFHDDAEQASHQCAATLLSNGQVEKPACSSTVLSVSIFLEATPTFECRVSEFSPALLPPERAPPVLA